VSNLLNLAVSVDADIWQSSAKFLGAAIVTEDNSKLMNKIKRFGKIVLFVEKDFNLHS
tara:strand:+ start:74333 stop:74506 length:174 start_codon:yes stop_codon:yes gene_type:complete